MARTATSLKVASYGILAVPLILLTSLCGAYFVDTAIYADFFGGRDPEGRWRGHALLHIGPAAVALMFGAVQLVLTRGGKSSWLHPALGAIYVAAVWISAVGAALILPRTLGGPFNVAGFLLLDLFWLASTAWGVLARLSGRPGEHRAWMLRSYTLTLAGVSLRIQLVIMVELVGLSFETAYALTAWTSWIPNIVVVEWLIARRSSAGKSRPAPHASTTGTGRSA